MVEFFKSHSVYDYMPKSTKVIVFDLDTSIKETFIVVEETGIEYSLLWDGEKKEYIGMLTVSDFLDVLIHFNDKPNVIKELIEKHKIRKWREIGHRKRPNGIIVSSPEDSLFSVLQVIQKNNIRRVPAMEKENLIHISTYHSIFSYLVKNLGTSHEIFHLTLEELKIGNYKEIITAKLDDKLFDVISKFSKFAISAVPIVNNEGVVINVYSRGDLMYITKQLELLEKNIEEAIKLRPKIPIFTCTKSERFVDILQHLATTRVHRVFIVDNNNILSGIITIQDIFKWIFDGIN